MPASGPSLNGIAAIKAIPSTQLANRTMLWDSSNHDAAKLYVYNAASTATADDDLILMPSDSPASGRWEKNAAGGGGVIVDSAIVTALPNELPGIPNYPSLKPTATPGSIGETRFIYRQYSGVMFSGFFTAYELTLTRSAYYTAIGATAADWVTDRSGAINIEYFTETPFGGTATPIGNNPGFTVGGTFRVQADYSGQLCYTNYATVNGSDQSIARARIVDYDTGLPVVGSTTQWWDWQSV